MDMNCQHFMGGHCTNYAAPRQLIGLPQCVEIHPPRDARLRGCALVYPYKRPDGYPLPPPSTMQTLGSQRAYTVTPDDLFGRRK